MYNAIYEHPNIILVFRFTNLRGVLRTGIINRNQRKKL
jgi:hypothetical protein